MRAVAVITSVAPFQEWARRQPDLLTLGDDIATGGTSHHDAWTAHRLDDLSTPWEGGVSELVMLPADGEPVAQPSALLPQPAKKAA